MLFMVNVGFGRTNSGIESSEFTRLKLFKQYQYPAKILSVAWYPELHHNLKHFKLLESDVINLYDYLIGNTEIPVDFSPVHVEDLQIPVNVSLDAKASNKRHYIYQANGVRRLDIVTWSDETTQVDTVNYFGSDGKLSHSETYDSRGFLATKNYFKHEGNQLQAYYRVFYDYLGNEKLTINYGRSALEQAAATRIELKDYHGGCYYFKTDADLKRFFLDEINTEYGLNNAFIVDRGLVSAWSVINMQTPSVKTMFIHATHVSDFRNEHSKLLNNNYEYAFHVADRWDNIIASTKFQQQQILRRFGHLTQKVYAIPVGVLSDDILALPQKPMAQRLPHSLVTLSRLDRQKSVTLQVAAVALVAKKFPDVVLHIYGEGVTKPELAKEAERLGIAKNVELHGWVYDKAAALADKQIFLETSNSEAFGLSMMEAQGYGLPLITTPVESATELIDDGVSGYIVSDIIDGRDKLVKQMAKDILNLFQKPQQLQTMSDAAYQHAQRFSAADIWQRWSPWVKDAQKSSVKGLTKKE